MNCVRRNMKITLTGIGWNDNIIKFHQLSAGVAELADALDLGSSVPDVQVQVLSPALYEYLIGK